MASSNVSNADASLKSMIHFPLKATIVLLIGRLHLIFGMHRKSTMEYTKYIAGVTDESFMRVKLFGA